VIPYGKLRPVAVKWEPVNSYTLLYLLPFTYVRNSYVYRRVFLGRPLYQGGLNGCRRRCNDKRSCVVDSSRRGEATRLLRLSPWAFMTAGHSQATWIKIAVTAAAQFHIAADTDSTPAPRRGDRPTLPRATHTARTSHNGWGRGSSGNASADKLINTFHYIFEYQRRSLVKMVTTRKIQFVKI